MKIGAQGCRGQSGELSSTNLAPLRSATNPRGTVNFVNFGRPTRLARKAMHLPGNVVSAPLLCGQTDQPCLAEAGCSTCPRDCSHNAADQQISAQAEPTHQPASTSLG